MSDEQLPQQTPTCPRLRRGQRRRRASSRRPAREEDRDGDTQGGIYTHFETFAAAANPPLAVTTDKVTAGGAFLQRIAWQTVVEYPKRNPWTNS